MSQEVIELTMEISPRRGISKLLHQILPPSDDSHRAKRIKENLGRGEKLNKEIVKTEGLSPSELSEYYHKLIDGDALIEVEYSPSRIYQKIAEELFEGSFLLDGSIVLSNGRVFLKRKYELVK